MAFSLPAAALLTALLFSSVERAHAQETPLPRATPEAEGVSSTAIREFLELADQRIDEMHSFMLVRHGKVIAEAWWQPNGPEDRHVMWSLSKSFTATAVGLAAAEGKLNLDDRVLSFFPDQAPAEASENLRQMRVRDLLTMSGGHEEEPKFDFAEGPTVAGFFQQPVTHLPGTFFRYNTPGTFMLSAIVSKATGETVAEYLKPRLFDPLGITAPKWDLSKEGYSIGGYGLHVRTEDVAKFGLLYLNQGKWNGKPILSKDWVAQATSKQVDNSSAPSAGSPDWKQGYGFQFWMCRHGAFRGDGRDGQFCIVLPDQDAVIAITAKTGNMQAQLDLIWEKLLPAFQDAPLPENQTELESLRRAAEALKNR